MGYWFKNIVILYSLLHVFSVACHCKTRQNEETPQTNVVGQIRLGENL